MKVAALWLGRIVSTLVIVFLAFDTLIHLMAIKPVLDAFIKLGLSLDSARAIGALELFCLVLYVVPRTAVFGGVLLTGYLGGAVAIHLRAGSTLFETVFPVVIGLLVWIGLWLRSSELRIAFKKERK